MEGEFPHSKMAKAYSDDLRQRYLSAYEQGEETLEELAERFMVSLGYGKKLRRRFQRTDPLTSKATERIVPVRFPPSPLAKTPEQFQANPVFVSQIPEELRMSTEPELL